MGILSRIDDYNHISNPYELYDYMHENVVYGYVDINHVMHRKYLTGIETMYKTNDLVTTITVGVGSCLEQAALIGSVFERWNYDVHYYVLFSGPEDELIKDGIPRLHCIMLAEKDDKVLFVESSANLKRNGVHQFRSIDDGLSFIDNLYDGNEYYKRIEVDRFPVGLGIFEFIDYAKSFEKEDEKILKR